MDRREFLKSAGLGAAALGVAACAPGAVKETGADTGNKELRGEMLQNFPGIGTLGYGCMRWPTVKGEDGRDHINQEEVNRLVDFALAHGVNYFDTSPVYLGGDSERATAEALNRHPREEWLLATKLSMFGPSSFDDCVRMYRRSLEIFKTDHIDYYLLHAISDGGDFKNRFENSGIVDFLVKEREAGRIRHFGFSFHGHQEGFDYMMSLHEKYHWDFVQIQMNYMDWEHPSGRNTRADYLYAELDKREIPIVIMEPLRGGALANPPQNVQTLMDGNTHKRSAVEWAFAYIADYPGVATILSGMSTPEQLDDNLRIFDKLTVGGMTEEDRRFAQALKQAYLSRMPVKCTACQYCQPCPPNVHIPAIFQAYNGAKMFDQMARFQGRYQDLAEKGFDASRCVQCGACEAACPQHLSIIDWLQKIDSEYRTMAQ